MDLLGVVREDRADLTDAVADRDDEVKRLIGEGVEMFRLLLADVNADRGHRAHCIRMHFGRLAASTEGADTTTAEVLHDALGHLRTCAIVRTEKQDARYRARVGGGYFYRCGAVADDQRRVQCRTSREITRAQQIEIETVVDIAAIGGAAAFGHQVLIA